MNFKKVIYDSESGLNKGDVYIVLFETKDNYFVIKYKSFFTLNPLYNVPLWWSKKDFKTIDEWSDKIKNKK